MNVNESLPPDEQFASVLAAWDEALAAGETPGPATGGSPELWGRLERGLAGILAAGTLSPSGQAMENEQDQALQAALGRLPEDYRRVITLRYQEQLPFEEIGRLLQRSPDAARKLWARAVERLHEELDPPP